MSPTEAAVCRRLREAREKLGLTAVACAAQLGIPRTTLLNYERAKACLPTNVALLFCRQFIVSEEWLATGRYTLLYDSALYRKDYLFVQEIVDDYPEFFFRECVDLWSNPVALRVPPRMPFGQAFSAYLRDAYAKGVAAFLFRIRIVFRDEDSVELLLTYTRVVMERYYAFLTMAAKRFDRDPGAVRREFLRCVYEISDVIFKRFHGWATPELKELDWLRVITTFEDAAIGGILNPAPKTEPSHIAPTVQTPSLAAHPDAPESPTSEKKALTELTEHRNTADMKLTLLSLLDRVRSATQGHGKKAELAAHLGVPQTRVSEWLHGKNQPGGEITLKLLQWVESQERGK